MNLRSLEYFLVVAEEMSISRAAERLFITQQALSSHIKRLETEYDAVLFHRKPVLALTPKGEELRYWASRILSAEKNLRANLYDIGTNCRGHIRIGIARLRANRVMPEVMTRYSQTYPNVTLEVADGNTDAYREMLQVNKLDMYIGSNVDVDADEVAVPLVTEAIWGCVRPDVLEKHLQESGMTRQQFLSSGPDIRLLPKMPLLVHQPMNRSRRDMDKYYYDAGIRPNVYFECNSQPLLYDLAQRGMGMALLSPIVLYGSWRELNGRLPDLFAFPLPKIAKRNLFLVYRTDEPLPQYARDFIQAVRDVFRGYGQLLEQEEQAR